MMENDKNIERQIEDALNSINGINKATPKPYLLTRINTRLSNPVKSSWENVAVFISRPSVMALGLCLVFAKHHPIWAFFLTAVVSLGLMQRLKKHWRERNWLAFFITFPFAFFCIGLPASLVWLAIVVDTYEISFDIVDQLLFGFSTIFGLIFGAVYFLTTQIWQNSRLAKTIVQIKRGARIITNLNED